MNVNGGACVFVVNPANASFKKINISLKEKFGVQPVFLRPLYLFTNPWDRSHSSPPIWSSVPSDLHPLPGKHFPYSIVSEAWLILFASLSILSLSGPRNKASCLIACMHISHSPSP